MTVDTTKNQTYRNPLEQTLIVVKEDNSGCRVFRAFLEQFPEIKTAYSTQQNELDTRKMRCAPQQTKEKKPELTLAIPSTFLDTSVPKSSSIGTEVADKKESYGYRDFAKRVRENPRGVLYRGFEGTCARNFVFNSFF